MAVRSVAAAHIALPQWHHLASMHSIHPCRPMLRFLSCRPRHCVCACTGNYLHVCLCERCIRVFDVSLCNPCTRLQCVDVCKSRMRLPCLSVQVLRWYGYFKEAVTESAVENFRVRKVVIFFYLEDNSCQVVEPKEDNSGLPQVLPCAVPCLKSCPVPSSALPCPSHCPQA